MIKLTQIVRSLENDGPTMLIPNYINPDTIERAITAKTGRTVCFVSGQNIEYQETAEHVANAMAQHDK